jgi:hypothetical protein
MGLQFSKSKVAVDSVIKAGISVLTETVAAARVPVTQQQDFNIADCTIANSHIELSQICSVNFSSLLTQIGDQQLQTQIANQVSAAASAAATAGLGLSGAAADTVVNSLVDVSQQIIKSAQSSLVGDIHMEQSFTCTKGSVTGSYITMDQAVNSVIRLITTNSGFVSATQNIKNQIDAIAASKATGYDPFAIFGLALIALIVLVIGGVAVGLKGVQQPMQLLQNPKFWLAVIGGLSFADAVFIAMYFANKWPYKAVDEQLDSSSSLAAKLKYNRAMVTGAGIFLGAGAAAGAGVVGYMAYGHRKPRP